MKNSIQACVISLLLSAVLFSCGRREPKFVIGVSQCSEDVWRKKLNDELRIAAFSNNNVELKISSANDDAELQTQQIDSFVKMGVDLLIVAPGQMKVTQAVDRAYDKGIPVIVFDRRTHSDKYTAYIGADNEEMGRNIAHYLSSSEDGAERIVEICGLSTSSPAVDRRSGFDQEVAKHADMDIVEHIEADWTEQTAYRQMDSMLSVAHPQFNTVFAHNDRMAMGARKAVMKHGLDPSKIHFIGIDAISKEGGGMRLVRDGELLASYIYPTRGDNVMELAMNILEKRKYKKENLLSSALVTADNANVLLMQEEEMKRQTDNLLSLRKKVETTTNAFDTQRSYLFMLLFLVVLLIIACMLALKAYMAKTRYNRQLKDSMQKQKEMTEDMERMTQNQLRFFTNISHELRTPLTLISGPADQLAESHDIGSEPRKLVEMIRRNVGILKQMVGEILEFRKIQNEKATLSLNRFCLAAELRTWSNDFMMVAARKDISLKVSIREEGDGMAIADKEKVAHIYFNLMTNALKYTPPKGTVTTTLEHAQGRYTISVEDTGKGMSATDRQHIFERFYQTKDSVGGTGIGLAIVKAYVDLHHGEVQVESEQGRGSRFSFSIPESQPGYDAAADRQTDRGNDRTGTGRRLFREGHHRRAEPGIYYRNGRLRQQPSAHPRHRRQREHADLSEGYPACEIQGDRGAERRGRTEDSAQDRAAARGQRRDDARDGRNGILQPHEGGHDDMPHPGDTPHRKVARRTTHRGIQQGGRLLHNKALHRRNPCGAHRQSAQEPPAAAQDILRFVARRTGAGSLGRERPHIHSPAPQGD